MFEIFVFRFHYKSWQQWRKKNQDVKLIVKHKPEACTIEFSNPVEIEFII